MSVPHILVVDDEPDIRELMKDILVDEGYSVGTADDGEAARRAFQLKQPDLVLLDIWMPDIDGISLLKEWLTGKNKSLPVIMISGHGTVETAVEATRMGAVDFLEKPISLGKLLLTVKDVLSRRSPTDVIGARNRELSQYKPVGRSRVIKALHRDIDKVVNVNNPILLYGERGVGKSFWAQYIHAGSRRFSEQLNTIDALWLTGEDAAKVLFGEEGSDFKRTGMIEKAKGGTLVIKNIDSLNSAVLAQLYSVVSTGQYYRCDGNRTVSLDTRLIFTLQIQRNLTQVQLDLISQVHRVSAIAIEVPALRIYAEDVPELLTYFVKRLESAEGMPFRMFSVAAQNRLRQYDWPNNLAEMKMMVQRLLLFDDSEYISLAVIDKELNSLQLNVDDDVQDLSTIFAMPLREAREQFEKRYLLHHLNQNHGNVGKVATIAAMERTHLYRKIRALEIDLKQEKTKTNGDH